MYDGQVLTILWAWILDACNAELHDDEADGFNRLERLTGHIGRRLIGPEIVMEQFVKI